MQVLGYCRNLRSNLCPCFVCCKKFSLDNGVEDLLTHICFTHRIVIENIERISDFQGYMEYYVKRLQESSLESFTKPLVIEISEKDSDPKERKYFLLGNSLEDENLRKTLHSKRLKVAQKQQIKDLGHYYYERHCFYCHQTLEVTNAEFIHHLRSHGFHFGHPDKLVYIDQFIEAIEDNFRSLHCLYCDGKFESCRALIKHMSEKNHQKIHPNNRFYDQFYMINYVEYGKTWLDFVKNNPEGEPEEKNDDSNDDLDWSSWGTEPEYMTCLFCSHVCRSWDGTLLHMLVSHNFDFKAAVSHLNFYEKVKVVNYIRRQFLDKKCIGCDFRSIKDDEIISHVEKSGHLAIPDREAWDCEEYFYCVMENDFFLYHLEDDECQGTQSEMIIDQVEPKNMQPSESDISTKENDNNTTDKQLLIQMKDVSIVNKTPLDSIDYDQGKGDFLENAIQTHGKNGKKIEANVKTVDIAVNHVGGGDCAAKIIKSDELTGKIFEFSDVVTTENVE